MPSAIPLLVKVGTSESMLYANDSRTVWSETKTNVTSDTVVTAVRLFVLDIFFLWEGREGGGGRECVCVSVSVWEGREGGEGGREGGREGE